MAGGSWGSLGKIEIFVQTKTSQKTLLTTPLWACYGASSENILEKRYCEISRVHCNCALQPHLVHSVIHAPSHCEDHVRSIALYKQLFSHWVLPCTEAQPLPIKPGQSMVYQHWTWGRCLNQLVEKHTCGNTTSYWYENDDNFQKNPPPTWFVHSQ